MHFTVFSHVTTTTTLLTFLCLIAEDQLTTALRDVRVNVPHAVRRGEKATLKCYYDIEDDTLYSVKWYKGRREFYRYTPKETPAMKLFQFAGIKVERSASNESQLVLDSVNMATTGKYSCEVSADAPSFHTLISAGELEVVEVPGKDPIITGIRPRYRVGDIVRGNCTSRHSKPAANLTWTINGYETNPSHIRHHKPLKDARELETSVSGIHFVVTPQHFIYGKLKIRCTAHIHDVYWKSTEKSIEEERHKHSGLGNSINLVNTFSDDYFDVDEENLHDRSDTYMTHIKGDVSSLNANSATKATLITLLPRAIAMLLLLNALQQFMQLFIQQMLEDNENNNNKKLHTNNNSNKNGNSNKTNNKTHNCNGSSNIAKGQHLSVANVAAITRSETNVKTKDKYAIKTTIQQQEQQNLLIIKKTSSSNMNTNNNNYDDNNKTNNCKNLCRATIAAQQQKQKCQQQQLLRMKLTMTANSAAETTATVTTTTIKSCYLTTMTSVS